MVERQTPPWTAWLTAVVIGTAGGLVLATSWLVDWGKPILVAAAVAFCLGVLGLGTASAVEARRTGDTILKAGRRGFADAARALWTLFP